MRKSNSNFKTAFVSEAGKELKNNDFFGFVELDEYACYVIADGISSEQEAAGAKKAVQSIISLFQENPSIKERDLRSYLNDTNKRFLDTYKQGRLKASVTVIVTNYEYLRYAYAGNTRLRMYRNGAVIHQTEDMSLAQDYVNREVIGKDKLARHEERNNLTAYLGQRGDFSPFYSKKIKLRDADAIAIYTRGIWENLDEGEIDDAINEASDDPQPAVDNLEEMLLSKQPEELDNYTLATIFFNKVFIDPKRKKRLKKIILITVIVLVLAIIITLVIYFWQRSRNEKINNMNFYFESAVTYMADNNYIRAKEDIQKAYDLAVSLRKKEMRDLIDAYVKLVESIIYADELLAAGEYQSSQEGYLVALSRSYYADNAGYSYIYVGLQKTETYMSFFETMNQAEQLYDMLNYNAALDFYMEAKRIASGLYFTSGKQQALDGIDACYEALTNQAVADDNEARAYSEEVMAAAELLAQGDIAFVTGDYDSALTYYMLAYEKYLELEDEATVAAVNEKIEDTDKKIQQRSNWLALADEYADEGQAAYEEGNYVIAQRYYELAKQLYVDMGMATKVAVIDIKLEMTQLAIDEMMSYSLSTSTVLNNNSSDNQTEQDKEATDEDDAVDAA